MKYIFAFIITILLHFIIYTLLLKNEFKDITHNKISSKKSNVQFVKLKAKPSVALKKQKEFKKYIKPKKKKKSILKKKVPIKKNLEKHKEKILKKQIIKKTKIQDNLKNNIIDSFYEKKEIKKKIKKVELKEKKKKLDKKTQSFVDLYGKDFDNLEKKTKLYLIKNLSIIGEITERFLEYPTMSIQAGQSGTNVVEFMLYEDGEIKDLKITNSSGFFLLDDNTLETIEEAYSDYPRPSKPTQIKIYVKYILSN